MRETFTKIGVVIVFLLLQVTSGAQKRIYIANDDHTDYMWTGNEADYDSAFCHMLDWWIDHNDATLAAYPGAANYYLQSKWNCDGSFWASIYEKYRSPAQFTRFINQIKNGQITLPYSPLISTYGGVPAEAILRGMYYAGSLERRYNIDLDMATAMENQTLPLGLGSLWRGAGAKYCWHGVCGCYTQVPGLTSRQNEMYWYKGLDTNKVLLKWYNYLDYLDLGGYAEVRNPTAAVSKLAAKCGTAAYPYNIAAGFGYGNDDFETEDDLLEGSSNASQQVIVSNEVDFFKDFENTYGGTPGQIPEVAPRTFGNEWDLSCASIAEVSAKVKRSVEKLRGAEAMAAIITNYNPTFAGTLDSLKKAAWSALGLYWEHDFGFNGVSGSSVSFSERNAFQRRLETTISSYVNQLYNLARSNLSDLITNQIPSTTRFFAFNPLGWKRTNYADYAYTPAGQVYVMDVTTNTEAPSQTFTKNGVSYLRILADSIPSIGYKVFEIRNGTTAFPSNWFTTGTNGSFKFVENDSYKVTYTNQGVITSIIDKLNGNKEMVKPGEYVNDLGSGNGNNGTAVIENSGPVSVTVLTTTGTGVSPAHTTRITLFKNIARIEIDNQITQNFSTTKTWTYSFNINNPEVWHEETGAVIRAKLNNHAGHYATQNARYDWSTLNHFASVNDTVTNYGITLSNQDCYFMKIGSSSVATLDENSAQLNVLAGGAIGGFGIPGQGGDAIFNQRFAITSHTGYSAAAEMKNALEHQDSMICGAVYNPVNFLLPNQYAYITNDNPDALIWSVKPAEEGIDRGTITRVWNLDDIDATSTLTYSLVINQAKRTTHLETDIGDNIFGNRNLLIAIGHNEMKTFRVKLTVIPLAAKPVILSGDKAGESNVLHWNIDNEAAYKSYELERSIDGQQFAAIATINATGNANNNYTYTDKNLNIAIPFYYRVKIFNKDNNSFSYSNTILIKAANEASNIVLFPNPVTDILNANFILTKKIRAAVAIYDMEGKIVKTFEPPLFERGNNYYTMPIKDLPPGEYVFSVIAGDQKFTKKFVKESH
ncbi:T9SS type A sorting domain-containing protein [Ferruginibacter profundus]